MNLLVVGSARMGIAQRNKNHSVVNQGRQGADGGGFLAAAQSACTDENAGRLSPQGAGSPQTTGSVPEVLESRGEVAVSGGNSKQKRIVLLQCVHTGHRHAWSWDSAQFLHQRVWQGFFNFEDIGHSAGRNNSLLSRQRQLVDVVVERIRDDCGFWSHVFSVLVQIGDSCCL
ncbi:hypothetical protein EJF18_10487 [Clavispora lusitaniae]|uniref:Uncharacterized protein n=2 Tax=Clavispora lusitaniae TaxID=36911 RepID=C4XX08_CLAL4|nr:uncharacterized protein CLUG_00481 [Clavispora lusitaniae ATCC 42720]QFZ25392.1 hypothetical protein EJF14_10487 [Clavispora lusitaniae]EEQ36359.1 hypothetical protein CLUG_00481 [Clavispora lusitaniae ATCC 42720]QFZ31305.1 hypothetical protein EJF16_10487 [Clavispora lusitaniae]QFZ36973.1 hypothetical protein EJF15_10487 [Clavispora lusitaniae]QFZ42657.1 hypothetical protein EJF18_10487 [Clavispora lusitaniae]